MAKIDDVARLAGVSTATVSRALRGLPVVNPQTRDRVLSAAAELGYVASPSASRLAGGRSGSVGVVVPRVTRWFFATLVDAVEEVLRASGHDVLLFNLSGRQAAGRLLHGGGLDKRVDALILACVPRTAADDAVLDRLGMPVVVIGGRRPGWGSVCIDDVAAARTATEHLVALGHRRIAHLAGDPYDEFASTVHIDRRTGYRQALAAAGLACDEALEVEVEFTVDGGAGGMAELLRRGDPPTAVFAACDEIAMGAMRTLRERGLRVPEDVSVIGIDDHDLSAVLGLTTVAQPAAAEGRLAASMLLESLTGGANVRPLDVVVPTRLVRRETTGPPRSAPVTVRAHGSPRQA
ncbi:LacI family DNA-binding transcriptional regulator [Planosporangium sp. 12N6]|uniref:LacI family DNA-binding transcriptional regulator n=1 Tax=Planosporangium spinosum TaxID=3402278 RepID=UPI003CF7CDDA